MPGTRAPARPPGSASENRATRRSLAWTSLYSSRGSWQPVCNSTLRQGKAEMKHFSRVWLTVGLCLALLATVPAGAQTLRMVAHSDLKVLDPIWTTAFITRNHGYLIYDTLFAKDADLRIQPQMVERYDVSPDKLSWTFILRDGLQWHDGTPVTAEDCVASIKRWGARDSLGQQLMASVGDIKAVDPKTFTLLLKE